MKTPLPSPFAPPPALDTLSVLASVCVPGMPTLKEGVSGWGTSASTTSRIDDRRYAGIKTKVVALDGRRTVFRLSSTRKTSVRGR